MQPILTPPEKTLFGGSCLLAVLLLVVLALADRLLPELTGWWRLLLLFAVLFPIVFLGSLAMARRVRARDTEGEFQIVSEEDSAASPPARHVAPETEEGTRGLD